VMVTVQALFRPETHRICLIIL